MFPVPANEILKFDYHTELDILINEMRLFMGLKRLEVLLLSQEKQKTSGTNPSWHSGVEQNMFHGESFDRQSWGKNKERRNLLFYFTVSLSV